MLICHLYTSICHTKYSTQVELQLGSSDDEDVNEATKSYEENLKNLSAEEIAVQ